MLLNEKCVVLRGLAHTLVSPQCKVAKVKFGQEAQIEGHSLCTKLHLNHEHLLKCTKLVF